MLAEIAVDNELVAVELDVDSDVTELFVLDRPVDSELTPVDSELAVVDVEVDNDVMLLVTLDSPVDNELTPVDSELAVVDVDVDNDVTVLLVLDRPVDSELMPVEVDVESEFTAWLVALSCEPLIASVLVASTRPAATFVI
ncbi:hypothetical protein ACJ51O_23065 [Burkholderia pyrrocinia]|uniref:hypothetical protein n=1 Tax=Burkholderia pyrrocinia TaxID=60550 RepID=UPI00215B2518|nr:hypothetical protein [Burkholderia pyrrocinia]UVE67872.1 hypothetical protein L2Y90_27545 [Burkholderia pyrrocinia]UVE67878.1 hypothetical protein L2Y90_27580 [Burkholderia pyrrocinia]